MICNFCGEEMIAGHTNFTRPTAEGLIIVRGTPCYRCAKCEQVAYAKDITGNLGIILKGVSDNNPDFVEMFFEDEEDCSELTVARYAEHTEYKEYISK